ncbi:MAG: hypothetical protein IPO08_11725 [Xanthomonadales bacterium]|nr:hypothetical protein [Xanthomonadales bacterium]
MRSLITIFAAMTLMACNSATVRDEKSAMPQPSTLVRTDAHEASEAVAMEFLLKSAATDFRARPPAENLHFRNVRLGYALTSESKTKYMLCGEFFSPTDINHANRGFFITIDAPGGPNGYNQLLGGQEISFCEESSVTWSNAGDLSSSLQSRFDSL